MGQGDAGRTGSGAAGVETENKGWTGFVNQIMCENLYFGKIFHLQKSAGLMVSSLIWNLLNENISCSSASIYLQCYQPPLTAGRQPNTPTCRGILTLPVPHTPHLDLCETETTACPFYRGRKWRPRVRRTDRHQRATMQVPEHEPTLSQKHIKCCLMLRSWQDPKPAWYNF